MSKLNDIVVGWSGLLKDKITNNNDSDADIKLSICRKCSLSTKTLICNPNKKGVIEKTYIYDGKTFNKGDIEYGCGCYLPAKVKSNSICPLNKW